MDAKGRVVTNPTAALDHHWYAVATTDQVGDAPESLDLLDVAYVLWRDASGSLVMALDECPHRQARLSLGSIDDGCLRCPYHGWAFGDAGRCVDIPSSGVDAPVPPTAHLNTLAVTERYGLIWMCPGEPLHPLPHIDVDDDPNFTRLNTAMQTWSCAASRMIDNMLDVAHLPYTHAGTFGREQEAEVPRFTLEQLDDTFHLVTYTVTVNNEGEAKTMSGGGDDVITIDMSTGFALPFSVRSTMSYDSGLEQVLFMTAAPMSDGRSHFTFVLWRNDDVSETGQGIVDFELEVSREDQTMLENLPGDLPLHHGALVDVQSDKASLEWRRRYAALLSGD